MAALSELLFSLQKWVSFSYNDLTLPFDVNWQPGLTECLGYSMPYLKVTTFSSVSVCVQALRTQHLIPIYPKLGHGGSILSSVAQTSLSTHISSSSFGGILGHSQAKETQCHQSVLGLPWSLLPMGRTRNQKVTRKYPEQMPETPQLARFDLKEASSLSKSLCTFLQLDNRI